METFAVGDKVLCYHGPLLYEAKILKIEVWTQETTKTGVLGTAHLVHYKGWKSSWDEWVTSRRLLKITEEHIVLSQMLANMHREKIIENRSKSSDATKRKHTPSASTTTAGSRMKGTTRKRVREEDETVQKPELKIEIPDPLKVVLVDDWENVTKNNQLVTLPRDPSVQQILKEFGEHASKLGRALPSVSTVLPTFLLGLELYFEKSLGNNLLYRFERGQYASARKKYVTGQHVVVGKELSMSEVYGCEHLLRLIVNLPAMVAQTTLDSQSVGIMRDYVIELMNFIMANKDRYIQSEYENASSEYLSLMRL